MIQTSQEVNAKCAEVTCEVSYLRFQTHVCSVCGWWTLHTGLGVLIPPPSFFRVHRIYRKSDCYISFQMLKGDYNILFIWMVCVFLTKVN